MKDNVLYDNAGNMYFPTQMDGSITPPFGTFIHKYGKIRQYEDGDYYAYCGTVKHDITLEKLEQWQKKPLRKSYGSGKFGKEMYERDVTAWKLTTFNSVGWKEFIELFPTEYPGFTVLKQIGNESFVPKAKEIYLDRYDFNIYYNEWPQRETIFEFSAHYPLSNYMDKIVMDNWERQYCPWFNMKWEFQHFVDEMSSEFMNTHFYNKNNWTFHDGEQHREYAVSKPAMIELLNAEIVRIWNLYEDKKYY